MGCKRSITLSVLTLAVLGCDAQSQRPTTVAPPSYAARSPALVGFHDDFAAALAEAARDRKPLLIYFTADWCTYCRQLEREVLERPDVREASRQFVCVRVDAGRQTGRCDEYRVRAYPTLILTDSSGTAVDRLVGLTTPTTLLTQLNATATSIIASLPELHPPATLQR